VAKDPEQCAAVSSDVKWHICHTITLHPHLKPPVS